MSSPSVSVMFPSQYLDFVEIAHPGWTRHLESSPLYARGAAPSGIVLAGRSREDLRSRGSYEIVRSLPGASPAEVHYEFLVQRDTGLPVGLIHDGDPQAMRTKASMSHRNTATGIRRLHVRVPRVAAVASRLDVDSVGIAPHEALDDDYLRNVSDLVSVVDRPVLLSVEVGVADLAAARACLQASGIDFSDAPQRLLIAPREGFGTGVQFVGRV